MARINVPQIGYHTPLNTEINIPGVGYFTSEILFDEIAPTVPANLDATASLGQVDLTWDASTDAGGVTGYNIYRDTVLIGTSATTTYTDSTIAANTSYSYTVAAYDASGNTSAASTASVVVTLVSNSSYNGGLYRPAAISNAATPLDLLYTKINRDETITGNWDFTGTLSINGEPFTNTDEYVHVEAPASTPGGSYVDATITHGLGTDDVNVEVIAYQAATIPTLRAVVVTPDGKLDEWHAWSYSAGTAYNTPASGQVYVRVHNTNVLTRTMGFTALITKR